MQQSYIQKLYIVSFSVDFLSYILPWDVVKNMTALISMMHHVIATIEPKPTIVFHIRQDTIQSCIYMRQFKVSLPQCYTLK